MCCIHLRIFSIITILPERRDCSSANRPNADHEGLSTGAPFWPDNFRDFIIGDLLGCLFEQKGR
jgi:hypothetical protein